MAKKKPSPNLQQPLPAPQPSSSLWFERSRLVAIGLFILSIGIYLNTLGHDFVQDDAIVLTDNGIVKKGIKGWGELFSNDTFYGFWGENKDLVEGGRYRPLTPAMLGLEYQLFQSNPFGYHLVNLLWYAGCVLLIYFFFVQVARHRSWSLAVPLVIALIFAVHPLHTEAVANIKGRDEIVALCGAMGAAFMVWRGSFKGGWKYSLYAGILLFLGFLAKENAITFLAVIPLWLYVFKLNFRGSDLLQMIGPVVAMGVALVIRKIILPGSSDEPVMEFMNNPFLKIEGGRWVEFTKFEELATVSTTLGEYLRLLVYPVQLSHDYYPRSIEVAGWSDPRAIGSLLLYLLLFAGGLILALRKKLAGAGILTYLICLSIVSNVFFSIGTLMSERFLFMPSLGFAMLIGAGFQWLKSGKYATLAWPLVLVASLLFSLQTVLRNPAWESNYILFTTDVRHQPRSAKLQNAAAGAKINKYRTLPETSQANNQHLLTEAKEHLNQAVQLHPSYAAAYFLRGRANLFLEDYAAAVVDYEHALDLKPDYPIVFEDLLVTLPKAAMQAGQQQGNLAQARSYLNRALNIDPQHYPSTRLMGVVAGVSGDSQGAIQWFTKAAELKPGDAGALYDLGSAYYQAGQTEEGLTYIQRAKDINPNIENVRRDAN